MTIKTYQQIVKECQALQYGGNNDEVEAFVNAPEGGGYVEGLFQVETEHSEVLNLKLNDYIVRVPNGGFQVWNEIDFEREFVLIEDDNFEPPTVEGEVI